VAADAFASYFATGASAGAALAGLLFVAISVSPNKVVGPAATAEHRILAASAFTALLNGFFTSMGGLIPTANVGGFADTLSVMGLLNVVFLGTQLRRDWPTWRRASRASIFLVASLIIYGYEFWIGSALIRTPNDSQLLSDLAVILLVIFGLGITRSWELLMGPETRGWGWLQRFTTTPSEAKRRIQSPASVAKRRRRITSIRRTRSPQNPADAKHRGRAN